MSAAVAAAWAAARKVLVIRLDNLGDVLMATPAMAALRESLPEARLTLLASPGGAALAPYLGDVAETIAFAAPWVRHENDAPAAAALGRSEALLVARLAAERFDAAVVFTSCTQSALPAALLCRMAGIPLRLAYSRENAYGLLSDAVAETDLVADGMRHEVRRQLDLVAAVGCTTADERLRFAVAASDRAALALRLAALGLRTAADAGAAGRGYFVVHVGASAPSRRWPARRFGSAAERLAAASGHVPVYTGGADEMALVDEARGAMRKPAPSLAGRLGLGELAALIEGAALVVCNNTGPAHLAAALGTPVVDLYALTNPQHTPWQVPSRVLSHDVPCRHCLKSRCPAGHHACLRGVEPVQVVEAGLSLLQSHRPSARPAALAAAPCPAAA